MKPATALLAAALLAIAALGFAGWTSPDNILGFASARWFCR